MKPCDGDSRPVSRRPRTLFTDRADRIDTVERAMLQFAYRWAPYGGGSTAEIFVEFGMPAHEYFDRVRKLVDRECATGRVASRAGAVIRQICDARLGQHADACQNARTRTSRGSQPRVSGTGRSQCGKSGVVHLKDNAAH